MLLYRRRGPGIGSTPGAAGAPGATSGAAGSHTTVMDLAPPPALLEHVAAEEAEAARLRQLASSVAKLVDVRLLAVVYPLLTVVYPLLTVVYPHPLCRCGSSRRTTRASRRG